MSVVKPPAHRRDPFPDPDPDADGRSETDDAGVARLLRRHFTGWGAETGRTHRGHTTVVTPWTTPAGRVYTKRHARDRKFVQEKQAYLRWSDRVRTPRLLDYDTAGRCLLLYEASGRAGSEVAESPELHRAAGEWLRRLHAIDEVDEDPVAWVDALDARLDGLIRRAESWVDPPIVERAVRPARALARRAPNLRRVPCHRDFAPHNWIFDGATVVVLDFEHARLDAAPWDFTRLARLVWPEQPPLRDAFLEGYGPVDEPFRAWVTALTRLDGLATLVWGLSHGDETFIAEGRAALFDP